MSQHEVRKPLKLLPQHLLHVAQRRWVPVASERCGMQDNTLCLQLYRKRWQLLNYNIIANVDPWGRVLLISILLAFKLR